ncbi:AIM24 family protein [Beggiatoa leptomitoformis]|uniref:AIM24 family protein n=1 Tax=Beggiatoa leptomitoformis TaxID=288004 RepID=UPI000706C298|nr:AIM24 family protein [Beggiatoa leptomitoformis]
MQGGHTVNVSLKPTETLFIHLGWLQYCPLEVTKRTRFLWSYRYPLLSYVANLKEMQALNLPAEVAEACITLGSKQDSHKHIISIELSEHKAVVLHPKYIIATRGDVHIKTRWILNRLHSWVTGRLRYIIFYGTGTIYVYGQGGISLERVEPQKRVRVDQHALIGSQANLTFTTIRNETFWGYYREKEALFDYHFMGDGIVIRQATVSNELIALANANPFMRIVNNFMTIIGKVLGF